MQYGLTSLTILPTERPTLRQLGLRYGDRQVRACPRTAHLTCPVLSTKELTTVQESFKEILNMCMIDLLMYGIA